VIYLSLDGCSSVNISFPLGLHPDSRETNFKGDWGIQTAFRLQSMDASAEAASGVSQLGGRGAS